MMVPLVKQASALQGTARGSRGGRRSYPGERIIYLSHCGARPSNMLFQSAVSISFTPDDVTPLEGCGEDDDDDDGTDQTPSRHRAAGSRGVGLRVVDEDTGFVARLDDSTGMVDDDAYDAYHEGETAGLSVSSNHTGGPEKYFDSDEGSGDADDLEGLPTEAAQVDDGGVPAESDRPFLRRTARAPVPNTRYNNHAYEASERPKVKPWHMTS